MTALPAALGSAVRDGPLHPVRVRAQPARQTGVPLGVPDPGDALLETKGRRTGQLRLTPVCDGQDGNTFGLLSKHGDGTRTGPQHRGQSSRWVKVRTGPRGVWRGGTAHILDDDNPRERQRFLSQAISPGGSALLSRSCSHEPSDRASRSRFPVIQWSSAQCVAEGGAGVDAELGEDLAGDLPPSWVIRIASRGFVCRSAVRPRGGDLVLAGVEPPRSRPSGPARRPGARWQHGRPMAPEPFECFKAAAIWVLALVLARCARSPALIDKGVG